MVPLKSPRTLLVIDDEPSVAAVLRRVFSRDVVHVCTDGEEALVLLETLEPDVIICDVGLPSLDGPSLYQCLLLQLPDLASRVLFISGGACHVVHASFLNKTTQPHLLKPFSLAQIREAVDGIAEQTLQQAV